MHKNLRLNENKILINCINSHDYGGFTYWLNFLKISKHIQENLRIFFILSLTKILKFQNT